MASARELTSRRAVVAALAASSSGRVISVFVIGAVLVRLAFGGPRWGDLAAVVVVLVLLGPVEWFIHRFLLHAAPGNVAGELLGTRDSHERHHLDPDDLDWLLLRRPNAIGSCLAIVVPFLAFAGIANSLAVGTAEQNWAMAISTAAVGLLALLHYEWVHLLVHSKYRPTSRYYAHLDRNHRLHHYRNERYWLGVTVDVGDRLLRTLPESREAVPLSDTVRTLQGTE